jgi:ribosomal protein L4
MTEMTTQGFGPSADELRIKKLEDKVHDLEMRLLREQTIRHDTEMERDGHAATLKDNTRELVAALEECRRLYREVERLKRIIGVVYREVELIAREGE